MTTARDPGFVSRLRAAVHGRVTASEPLARFSTYRIGGPATLFQPADSTDLAVGLAAAAHEGIPVFVLGLGSNVLLPDGGLDALVVRIGKGLDDIRQDGPRWVLGAGAPAPVVARRTAEAGWAGLEVMVGVPGTVGGGVYMNAGCHGGQWSDVVRAVVALDRTGVERRVEGSEIPFTYRRSGLGDLIVIQTDVELAPGDPLELGAEMKRLFGWRQRGTPFNQACCGSVFKNPAWPNGAGPAGPDLRTAGQLIEAAGLKGQRAGAVEVSPMHANYFVNLGGGRAGEVRELMARVVAGVEARFGVVLEPEVKVIGVLGEIAAW